MIDVKGEVVKTANDIETAIRSRCAARQQRPGGDRRQELCLDASGFRHHHHQGENTEVLLDSFLAEQGGTIELVSGDMVFDRPEGTPKIDLTIRTTFGQIGVRGTKFFTGKSRGNFAVFVEHGLVEGQEWRQHPQGRGRRRRGYRH